MKRTVLCLAVLGLLALGGQALAVICTIDDVPAATLLLPYFEVDLDNPDGVTTLFSINNASATAVLAHVVLWSDLSVEVLDFNVYLTGYDVQTINLRDVLNGTVPRTAPPIPDTGEAEPNPAPTPGAISNQGAFSDDQTTYPPSLGAPLGVDFSNCTGQLPPPAIPAVLLNHVRAVLTGKKSTLFVPSCYGQDHGDNIARGYVTVDTVNNCTLHAVGPNTGYFGAGGTGDITNQNVLWGDYFYVNTAENFAQGETLVHIEASPGDGTSANWGTYPLPGSPETTAAGQYTFYGRYVGFTAIDNREPLTTNFATRFINGGLFNGGTSLLVWRDSKFVQLPFTSPTPTCTVPDSEVPWYPLGQEGIVIFDEAENPTVPQSFPFSPQPPNQGLSPFPSEAQRTLVGGANLPVDPSFGWLYLNLNTTVAAAPNSPPEDPAAAQAWVTTEMDAQGRFSVGFDAIQLDSACTALHFTPGSP